LEQKWEELILAPARIPNGIQSLEEEVLVLKEDLDQFATGKLAEWKKTQQKKQQRSVSGVVGTSNDLLMPLVLELDDDDDGDQEAAIISWAKVLLRHGLVPDLNGLNTAFHIPLLQHS
jgi:hypothetical protein